MKFHKKLFALLCCSALLTGCSADSGNSSELPDLDSIIQEENGTPVTESAPEETSALPEETQPEVLPPEIYYLTDHGTQNPAELSEFRAQLETDGYLWNECTLSELPADAGILLCNSPEEDFTSEEVQNLQPFFDAGGDMMLLLPASESETRYKFLNNLLESFSLQMDYDRITEPGNDSGFTLLQIIGMPERMLEYVDSMSVKPVYMQNMRSFHILGDYATDELFIDVMLQTSADVIGEPCGGTEDDPLTYENEKLNVLLYSRNAVRNNAAVVVCGAADFLNDENFDADTSKNAQNWIYSSLQWFTAYSSY